MSPDIFFNLIPEGLDGVDLDEELRSIANINFEFEMLFKVNLDQFINPEKLHKIYIKIITTLVENQFTVEEVKLILNRYRNGESWINSDRISSIVTEINRDLDLKQQEQIKTLEKEKENQGQFPFKLFPYVVKKTGIYKTEFKINTLTGEKELNDCLFSSTPCFVTAIGENIDNHDILYKLRIIDNRHRERIVWKNTTDLMTRTAVTKLLKDGMHFQECDANKLIDYFDSCISEGKETLKSEIAASVSGWKENFSLFVVGNKGISINKEIEVLQQDNPTAELYCQKGDNIKWAAQTNKLIIYDPVRFKLYTACVPPLLKLLNIKSFVETQQTPTGRLKTTMGKLAASIWGDPERLQLNAESTSAGIQKTVEFSTDLPIFVDETSITDRIKELVYLIANGVGRSKSNSEGGLVMPSTWATVLLSTGEKPILPESALTGQQVRVVPLRDGVNEKLPPFEVSEIQRTIANNYGHVGILLLKELFKEKDNLDDLFKYFFNKFPAVNDITSDRAKEFYATIAVSGYLLEKVFKNIGVITKDSFDVCRHYFNENVISNSFVPDHIKALNVTYSWFSANEIYFQDEDPEHPLNHERYGWIKDDCICFIPDTLKKQLNNVIGANTYEAASDEWKNLGILTWRIQTDSKTGAKNKLKTDRISTFSGRKSVIKIPFSKFNEYLELEENKTPSSPQPIIKTPSASAEIVNSIDALEKITGTKAYTPNGSIIISSAEEMDSIFEQEV